jgi:hypothetical protein
MVKSDIINLIVIGSLCSIGLFGLYMSKKQNQPIKEQNPSISDTIEQNPERREDTKELNEILKNRLDDGWTIDEVNLLRKEMVKSLLKRYKKEDETKSVPNLNPHFKKSMEDHEANVDESELNRETKENTRKNTRKGGKKRVNKGFKSRKI